ncbi:MFS transporter [Candidatus Poribacteria bacterium]|nr:MFS transporter [Candidatus Poribacteria bacterium]MYF56212.1 MFS transporter [Candidatus Poribacteria bacterium]MYI94055.1 MFS transporter [Candidatus Poribacteria bacterium]
MDIKNKATQIELFSLKSVQMRTFHTTWFTFFLAFFGWFGIAPLMAIVREDLMLTKTQIGNTIIASVAITVAVRIFIGPLCDRIGARKAYTWLLILGSIPVMGIGLAHDYQTFLLFRLAIGAIGASFVITQYHTSVMFAPNCVGTANATTAGWGNLGGGVTQMVMPIIFTAILSLGVNEYLGWRLAMIIPGIALFIMGFVYYFTTQDAPDGNYSELFKQDQIDKGKGKGMESFNLAIKDYRVWALFFIYAACFGVELTINNIAALYYHDHFKLDVQTAGVIAGLFGLMNIFARTVGGFFSDFFAKKMGLKGRVVFLFIVLLGEGIMLMLFSRMSVMIAAIGTMIVFSLFVQMSEGATFGLVPFINRKALGAVAGIVGAGGNAGAVAAGFLFRAENLTTQQALLFLGVMVVIVSFATLLVRFSPAVQDAEKKAFAAALAEKQRLKAGSGYEPI